MSMGDSAFSLFRCGSKRSFTLEITTAMTKPLLGYTLWIGLKEVRTGLGDWFSSKDAFQRRFGAVERAGTDEKEERRGAWLIFYLRGDLASRARIPAFIDPYNHSPL